MNNLGLYIHIPFCVRKCGYCDFYSMEQSSGKKDRYLKALNKYIDSYSMQCAQRDVDTVYIGGGTPTCLDTSKLVKLIKSLQKKFKLTKNCEITVEANPGTVTLPDLKKLKAAGMTRLSVGAQSAFDDELTGLTRIYKASTLFDTLKAAEEAEIPEVSVDIMYGIPHQTVRSLLETIGLLTGYKNVNHVSLYGLTIEEGTDFDRYKDILPLPDEDTERDMYFAASERLEALGYKQYEISNFAKPSHESRHNLKYWNCEEYIGLGPGAHSYFANKRFSYKRDIDLFCADKDSPDKEVLDEYMEIYPKHRIGEYVMLRFRLAEGINTDTFYNKFGVEFDTLYFDKLAPYVFQGYVTKENGSYSLTREGMYISNRILSDILDI